MTCLLQRLDSGDQEAVWNDSVCRFISGDALLVNSYGAPRRPSESQPKWSASECGFLKGFSTLGILRPRTLNTSMRQPKHWSCILTNLSPCQTTMASQEVQAVLSTVWDGRSRDLRYRQRQFLSLHRWIVDHSNEIQLAICRDDKVSECETRFVIAAALTDIRTAYDSLDLKEELKDEYSIKRNEANEGRRVPDELVYLTLEKYTIFYCLVNVLAACLAAGSCCLIEVWPCIH
jgi:hypothetical protein